MEENIKIALIQAPLIWESPEANRGVFAKKIEFVSSDVDIIILPEMFTTGFTMYPNRISASETKLTLDWMLEMAQNVNAAVIGSMVYHEESHNYNRLLFVQPNGTIASYDKRHTFTLAGEHEHYTAGTKQLLVTYKGFSFCPMICYDLRFPVWSRNTMDYDVLLYLANWPNTRVEAWDTLLKARAIENMTYCVGVNRIGTDANGLVYSGHSAAYDALGKQLVFSDEEEILEFMLSKNHIIQTRKILPFLVDKDEFSFLE